MDDIKVPRRGRHTPAVTQRRVAVPTHLSLGASRRMPMPEQRGSQRAVLSQRSVLRIAIRLPSALEVKWVKRYAPWLRNIYIRSAMVVVAAVLVIAAEVINILQPYMTQQSYALGAAESLLLPVSQPMADELIYNANSQTFNFNHNYSPNQAGSLSSSGPQITATAYQDPRKGVTVTDTVNNIDFTVTPTFNLGPGKKEGNRIVYPLMDNNGWVVDSMHSIGVKEDVLLNSAPSDTMTLSYKLAIGNNLHAQVSVDGRLNVYGNTLFSGNVATGTTEDAKLLEKAREKAPKNTLLFSLPAPLVRELGRSGSAVKAHYVLEGNVLKVQVDGLKKAHYPLTIDPSIYVVTAANFMRGNNETNIDFDVADKLIRKGPTTGARFNSWTSTMSLPLPVWNQGTVAAGGYVYSLGGLTANSTIFNTAGASTYTVPAGVTSITVKAWGAGGGGGAGSGSGAGGAGGGGGYATATITVTPGEALTVYVGAGGTDASVSQGAGNGGGYSAVYRSSTSTYLIQAGGGGGGGGTRGTPTGGAGGAGGGSSGVAGSAGSGTSPAGGGGAGTTSAGGTGGTAGGSGGIVGATGIANAGGDGAGSAGSCTASVAGRTGGGNATSGAGLGGGGSNVSCEGGGGGGGGRFGGGGGGDNGNTNNRAGGGGGGGSGLVTGTGTTLTAGSGVTPGNSADPLRGGAGAGGTGGASTATNSSGTDGLVYITYGTSGNTTLQTLSWAQFDTSTGVLDSPNPGAGACSGWCSQSAYNLPSPRLGFSMVAYNGFLFVLGGEDSSCTTGNGTGDGGICKTVYITKLGANGEPQLWSPTSTDKTTWTYWYRDTDLSSPRSYEAAVAYNNRMYFLGGKTSSSGVVSVVGSTQIADITATGKLGSWSTSAALPYNVYGHSAQAYNDYLYLIGGASSVGGAPLSSVYYIKINSDGTLNSWIQTTSFATGRMTWGGNFTAMWGAYIYLSGGCTAVVGSGSDKCSTVASDTQLASINADGSLDIWNTNASVTDQRMGYGLITWRNMIYEFGGCTAQNTSDGTCVVSGTDNSLSSVKYGTINQDGDASTVSQSVTSGTAPCSGTNPYSCNLPSASVGNVLNETAIMNGYLYIMGGCTNNGCTSVSTGVTYQAIGSDGTLRKPATCTGTYTDSYCVSSSTLPVGLAAAATAVFNGRIYVIGGFNTGTNIYYVSVNTDGSLGAWSGAVSINTVTGGTATTLTYSYAYARANPASAGTNPGNLYIFGGCMDGSVGCSTYSQSVFKCNISTTGAPSGCTTTGQLQIGTIPGGCGTGLGAMAGAVYANYIYLIGGLTPSCTDLKTVRYAKFDNNNNIVTVSSGWVQGTNQTATGRRRGAGFGYNGYLYVVGGYDGTSGVLDDIEFAKINVSDGSWGSFNVSSVTINQRWGLTVPVSNSFAYVIGGCTAGAAPSSCTTRTNTTQTFQIYNNDSGSPALYSTSANTYGTNPNRIGASATVLNGYLYVAGGCTSTTDCTTAVNTVSYSAIDANGNLGSWSNTTGTFPGGVVRTWGKLGAAGGTLYYIGGQDSTATNVQSTVFYGTPSAGNVSTWTQASNGLPAARTKFGAAVWNDRIYVVGGLDGSSNPSTTVYVSPQLSAGGNITSAWSTSSTSINVARFGNMVTAYANNLYSFGGNDGTNYLNDGQYAQINSSTGLISGSWTYTTSLPTPLSQGDSFAANGYMYVIGGRSAAASCRPITLVAPISANTTITSGNNPTGVGEWYETNQRYTGDRYGSAAVYYAGKAYVTGGGCGATITYGSPVTQQTSLLSQPQLAKYSIMFDTDSDVFPNMWLLNGLDNSVGARWQLSYRSMKNITSSCLGAAMTTWGQTTNFGNVTLGTPGVYTPLDGSGTNTQCARFFYFVVTVDSSQAYGYPDDVTRGPTITDLTLAFTADPSKRLMHGRTFVGGLQQPDDTPCHQSSGYAACPLP